MQWGERGYSNWELSADRANASRRELIAGGLADGKVLRVVGMADTMNLKQAKGGSDAINRRISLVVLNKQAQENIERENAESSAVNIDKIENLQNMGMDKAKPVTAPADNGNSTAAPQPETNGTPVSGSTVAPVQAPATAVPASGANGSSATSRRQPTTALPAAPDSQATPSSTSRDSQQR
ncbi:hypothetical protein OS12_26930 [Dickeya oryzae]